MFIGNLRSKLPTDTILFVIQSVTTDDKFPSVVTDWITDEKVSVVKKRRVATWRFWQVIFSDGITDGFKKTARTATWTVRRLNCRRNHRGIWNGRSVRWHVDCSVKITDGSPIEVPSVKPSGKVNICPLCRPSPPLFLLLLPNPNSPHLQTTSPPSPPHKNLPHISTTSYISWSFVVTTSVFWFTDGFYQFL